MRVPLPGNSLLAVFSLALIRLSFLFFFLSEEVRGRLERLLQAISRPLVTNVTVKDLPAGCEVLTRSHAQARSSSHGAWSWLPLQHCLTPLQCLQYSTGGHWGCHWASRGAFYCRKAWGLSVLCFSFVGVSFVYASAQLYPYPIPDLYLGVPVVVTGKLGAGDEEGEGGGEGGTGGTPGLPLPPEPAGHVRGRVNGGAARRPWRMLITSL